MIPFLCLGGAFLVTEVARTISRWSGRPAAAPALAAIIASLAAAPSFWSAVETNRLLARDDNRLTAAAWLRERFPQGASLYQTGSAYGHLQMQREGVVPDPRYPEVPIGATPAADVIVVLRCSLDYCDVPADMDRILAAYVPLTFFIAAPIFVAIRLR